MQKLYSKKITPDNGCNLNPKEETVNFLLAYSKALSVIDYKGKKFEALLN